MPSLVRQPQGSSLCGQCCVAMAAGVSLDRAVEVVGHARSRGTYTREIRDALRVLGVGCADRCRRVNRDLCNLPRRGIVTIHTKGRRLGHWMLLWDGEMFDPENRYPDFEGWKITSFLEIES